MFHVRINGSLDVEIILIVVLWMPRGGMVRARGVVGGGGDLSPSPLHIRPSFNMDTHNQLVLNARSILRMFSGYSGTCVCLPRQAIFSFSGS